MLLPGGRVMTNHAAMVPWPGFEGIVTVVVGGETKVAGSVGTPMGLSLLPADAAPRIEVEGMGCCKGARDATIIIVDAS